MILRFLAGALLCILSLHAAEARPRRMPIGLQRLLEEVAGRAVGIVRSASSIRGRM